MNEEFSNWLNEIDQEFSLIASDSMKKEAHGNMYSFGLTREMLGSLLPEQIEEFIIECYKIYSNKAKGINYTFYSWYDEMAGQIRVSAIYGSNEKLPFGADYEIVETLELAKLVSSGESGLFTKNKKLKIWCKNT